MNISQIIKFISIPYTLASFIHSPFRTLISEETCEHIIYAFISLSFLIAYSGSVIGLMYATELQYRILIIPSIIGYLYLTVLVLVMKAYKKSIQYFLSRSYDLISRNENVQSRIEQRFRNVLRNYSIKMAIIVVCIFATSFFACVYERNFRIYEMYICPFCFVCSRTDRTEGFFCFEVQSYSMFFLVNVIEYVILLFGVFVQEWFSMMFTFLQVVFAEFSHDLRKQIEMMSERVQNAVRSQQKQFEEKVRINRSIGIGMKAKWNPKREHDKRMNMEFRKVILVHKDLYRYVFETSWLENCLHQFFQLFYICLHFQSRKAWDCLELIWISLKVPKIMLIWIYIRKQQFGIQPDKTTPVYTKECLENISSVGSVAFSTLQVQIDYCACEVKNTTYMTATFL